MKKEMFKKLTALAVCGIVLVLPVVSFAANGFITPWNSTFNFDTATFSYINETGKEAYPGTGTYRYMSDYSTVYGVSANCSAIVRDSYTDERGNVVYDNVTKTEGNKYLYFDNNRSVAGRPGYFFHNIAESPSKFTGINGGICHGKVTYELDLRFNNITQKDDNKKDGKDFISGALNIFALSNSKRTELITVRFLTNASGSYYFRGYNTEAKAWTSLGEAIAIDKWCHLKVTYEVGKNNVRYELYQYNDDGTMKLNGSREWGLQDSSLVNAPVFTSMRISGAAWCDTSIDNVSVTKETFAIGEKNITADDTNITATVKIANDVYANANVGTAIAAKSPKVILAAYGENNALINAGFADVEFTGHELASGLTDTERQAFFTKDLDYKDVTVTLPKTADVINAKVFVWNNMTDMFPYTVGDDLNGSSN